MLRRDENNIIMHTTNQTNIVSLELMHAMQPDSSFPFMLSCGKL
jgi:hypothetical protein